MAELTKRAPGKHQTYKIGAHTLWASRSKLCAVPDTQQLIKQSRTWRLSRFPAVCLTCVQRCILLKLSYANCLGDAYGIRIAEVLHNIADLIRWPQMTPCVLPQCAPLPLHQAS